MKIGFVVTRFSSGGAQINAINLAQEFTNRGDECKLYFLVRAGNVELPSRLDYCVLSDKVDCGMGLIAAFFRFIKHLKRDRADVLIGFHPLANVFCAISKFCLPKVKVVATQRNPSSRQNILLRWADLIFGTTPLYNANIAVSNAVKASFSKYPKKYTTKLTVVYNGFVSSASASCGSGKTRSDTHCERQPFSVGFIGRLAEQKNPGFLFDVMAELGELDVRLLIAGSGPLKHLIVESVKKFPQGKICYLGELEGIAVSDFYRRIDVFLLPSLYEGFGRTLVEAMQSGVPVCANDLLVTREVVGDAGRLLPLDPHLWSNHIAQLFNNRELARRYSERGEARAREFSMQSMVEGYLNVINAIEDYG